MDKLKAIFNRKKFFQPDSEYTITDDEGRIKDDRMENKDSETVVPSSDKEHNDNDDKGSGDFEQGNEDDTREVEEYEVVEREILPEKMICPDCGGITLQGLEFCDKCGGEL